ncbi:hypothetical protein DICA4_E32352 [Diutina catenulata]
MSARQTGSNPVTRLRLPKKGSGGGGGGNSPSPAPAPALVTSDDYLEQGSVEEESGDRWFGSDVAKALRFYQKAFDHYEKAISLGGGFDAHYNCARLLYYVYTSYTKPGILSYIKTDGVGSVVESLANIASLHERALALPTSGTSESDLVDLWFNAALVYTDVIEDNDDNAKQVGDQARQLLDKVVPYQLREFEQFVAELSGTSTSETASVASDGDSRPGETAEAVCTSVVQPTDLYESVIACYKLVQALAESGSVLDENYAAFIARADTVAESVVSDYSVRTANPNDQVENLSEAQVDELQIARCAITSLDGSASDCINVWNACPVDVAERYMVASDSLTTVMDRFAAVAGPQDKWQGLSQSGNWLKQAQTMLVDRYGEEKKSAKAEGLGSLLAQIAECFIARADVDVQRSQLDCDAARANGEVLLKNAKTLLKSAMSYAKLSGGLRERSSEKLARESKLGEAVFRMCVLEQKSEAEVDQILGRDRWNTLLPEVQRLGYYAGFGI